MKLFLNIIAFKLLFLSKAFGAFDANEKALLNYPEFKEVLLSPDGSKVAVSMVKGDEENLLVLDAKTLKPFSATSMGKNFHIDAMLWVNNEKIILGTGYIEGYLKKNTYAKGFIYSINFDGSKKRQIFPKFTKLSKVKSQGGTAKGGRYTFKSKKLFEKNFILIEVLTSDSLRNLTTKLVKLNVNSGGSSTYRDLNIGMGSYVLDNDFEPRILMKYKGYKKMDVGYKNVKGKWLFKPIDEIFPGFRKVDFIGFNKTNNTGYFKAEKNKGPAGLYSVKVPQKGKPSSIKTVFADRESEVIRYHWDHKLKELVSVDYGLGEPKRKYIRTKSKFSKMLKMIDSAFPDEKVVLGQRGDAKSVFGVLSSKKPKAFYIYDEPKKDIRAFLSTNEKVNTKRTVAVEPVSFTTRDNKKIHAFLYRPKNVKGPVPLLIHIHGGPFGVKERWGFDGYDQFFAQKGYASLKINFRGSGGRGEKFIDEGKGVIGTKMQYDIIDAANWAVKNKITTSKNICLWGVSYGGYSSVMSFLMRQDLFACALGAGGVYNMSTILKMGDIKEGGDGKKYWLEMLPKTKKEKLAHSPVSLAANLEKPLFIVHGKEDVRVPVAQARDLKKHLKKAKKKFKYKEYSGVGHWFVDNKNRHDFFDKALKFFDDNLKNQN